MGTQDVQANMTGEQRNAFMKALLNDIRALEQLLDGPMMERGITRIGAEQELVMVDRDWQPAPIAMDVLPDLPPERVTTEIARFNLECNLPPLDFAGDCLTRLEHELLDVISLVREVCRRHGAEIALTGILPTLAKSHLGRENIADRPRYFALDEALSKMRGGAYELAISGIDDVSIEHDSVLLEALNTSFQLHYQVSPESFAQQYNLAQAFAGPLLASAVNSPVLFGKRLWRETRIAIFQQTVDTRGSVPHERDTLARVRFGEGWVNSSVMEIYRSDVSRFRVILGRDVDEDPFEAMEEGSAPKLQALQLHNSTVYRWNRPCYGISNGKPHLRIENRILPAGPTVMDEVANAAFWFGLMHGGPEALGDIRERLDFDDVRANFIGAARQGMHAEFTWADGEILSARELLLRELLPIARKGLASAEIDQSDADRFLDIVQARVDTRRTGAQWLLDSVTHMRGAGTRAERLAALTAGTFNRQHDTPDNPAQPVHTWTLAQLSEAGCWTRNYQRVEQYMTTELFTVQEDDTIDLVMTLMDWEHIRHVPVEDEQHRLVGIVSYRPLLHHIAQGMTASSKSDSLSVSVRDIMKRNPVTVQPDTSTLDAIAMMRQHRVSCLPVVSDGRLVGIITEHDFMSIAGQLLEDHLRAGTDRAAAGE